LQDIFAPFGEWWNTYCSGLVPAFVWAVNEMASAWQWLLKQLLEDKGPFQKWMRKQFYMSAAGVGGESKEIISQDWLDAVRKNPQAFAPLAETKRDLFTGELRDEDIIHKINEKTLSGIHLNATNTIMQAEIDKARKKRLDAWKTFYEEENSIGNAPVYGSPKQPERAKNKSSDKSELHLRQDELDAARAARDAAVEEASKAAKSARAKKRSEMPNLSNLDFPSGDKTSTVGGFGYQSLAGIGGGSPMLSELKTHTNLMKKFVVIGAETSLKLDKLSLEVSP
jgi:hypothetical protein